MRPTQGSVRRSVMSGHTRSTWRGVNEFSPPLRGPATRPAKPPGATSRQITIGAALIFCGLIVLATVLGAKKPVAYSEVVYIAEKSTRAPGMLADEVRDHVQHVAGGRGQLVTYLVGSQVYRAHPVDLSVNREDGPEDDPRRRSAAIDHRLDALAAELDHAQVGAEGFNLPEVLQLAADESSKSGQRADVWTQTALLTGTRDPLQMSKLTAADPKAAADEVIKKSSIGKLDLSRVDLHPILVSPVGDDQEPLTPADETWAARFITELGASLGAHVNSPVRSRSTRPPWHNASVVPPIRPLEEDTPTAPSYPNGLTPVTIDTAVAFEPDTAVLVDTAATQQKLKEVISRYRGSGGEYRVEVKGFCAHFGPRDGALTTSSERARVIGQLLIPAVKREDIQTEGVGYDALADPTKDPQSPAQRAVIIRLLPRS